MEKFIDKLISIYGIRLSALGGYSDRIWKRFYWLLTIQVALFGFIFSKLEQSNTNLLLGKAILPIGLFIAFLWLLLCIEDYFSLKKYAKEMKKIEEYLYNYFQQNELSFHETKRSLLGFDQAWLLFISPIIILFMWGFIIFKM
jgi:uncharacterized membrane protein